MIRWEQNWELLFLWYWFSIHERHRMDGGHGILCHGTKDPLRSSRVCQGYSIPSYLFVVVLIHLTQARLILEEEAQLKKIPQLDCL